MGDNTGIEWCDATWNPIAGCSIVSPGCTNCYAMKMATRVEKMARANYNIWREGVSSYAPPESSIAPFESHYEGTTMPSKAGPVWTGKVAVAPDNIFSAPLRWKKPRKIFVNSMSDLFHESVQDDWIDRIFTVMALSPQHTFQILTKRSTRMREYLNQSTAPGRVFGQLGNYGKSVDQMSAAARRIGNWPLPNVWLGVSAEDQKRADERVPDLLETPAAVRFVSAEPLLGAIELRRLWLHRGCCGAPSGVECPACPNSTGRPYPYTINWIIVGGESGPGARPMHPDWARFIRDQCDAAGVAFHFKQWGEYAPCEMVKGSKAEMSVITSDGQHLKGKAMVDRADDANAEIIRKFGKAAAGRLLDGVEHNGFPEVKA